MLFNRITLLHLLAILPMTAAALVEVASKWVVAGTLRWDRHDMKGMLLWWTFLYFQVRLQRSAGSYLAGSDGSPASAETIQANISEITNFHDSVNPTTPADAFRAIMQAKGTEKVIVWSILSKLVYTKPLLFLERKPSTSSSPEGNSPTSSETRDKKTTDKAPEIATQHDYVFEHLKTFLSQV